jgi:phytoene dehydrogenase-like protein
MSARAASPARYDCVVIGAGHNGLCCATFLARSGRSVLVLEASARPGGAAQTREFAPGFKVSAGAHLLHQMSARMIRELGLEQQGLRWAAQDLATVALRADAAPLVLGAAGIDGLGQHADSGAYLAFREQMGRFAGALGAILESTPPRLGTDRWADKVSLLKLGWRIRSLGRRDLRELLRIGGMNAYDLLTDHFQTPALQGALGFDAVLGTNFGPRAPGTVMTLLYRLAAGHGAGKRGLALPAGGMGAVCDALARAAQGAGAELRTAAPVARILIENDRACGVRLESGEIIAAGAVISSADPKTSFLSLVGAEHLDAGFARQVNSLRTRGLAAKLHLALSGKPKFTGLAETAHASRLLIAPSLDYLERAFNHSKYGEYSRAPAIEITLPSLSDPGLAGAGRHVLSAIVQYAPFAITGGWAQQRERFTRLLIDTIAQYAPGLGDLVVSAELLTPEDMEREFRISGGHWHHADLALDQFFMVRPVPGATQYGTPLAGFYLCGAGCHPGGGVMGIAGRNAARQVIAQAA